MVEAARVEAARAEAAARLEAEAAVEEPTADAQSLEERVEEELPEEEAEQGKGGEVVEAAGAGTCASVETTKSREPPTRRTSARTRAAPELTAALPGAKQYGQEIVGAHVSVQWACGGWFDGTVKDYSPATNEHCVSFEDGDQKHYRLNLVEARGHLSWQWTGTAVAGSSGSSRGGERPAASSAAMQPQLSPEAPAAGSSRGSGGGHLRRPLQPRHSRGHAATCRRSRIGSGKRRQRQGATSVD